MKTTDIIRTVLDILDASDQEQMPEPQAHKPESRFRAIYTMLSKKRAGPLANTPNEVVAPISAVTTDAGGGVNGPKHPHDIRVKDPSAYPDQQEY